MKNIITTMFLVPLIVLLSAVVEKSTSHPHPGLDGSNLLDTRRRVERQGKASDVINQHQPTRRRTRIKFKIPAAAVSILAGEAQNSLVGAPNTFWGAHKPFGAPPGPFGTVDNSFGDDYNLDELEDCTCDYNDDHNFGRSQQLSGSEYLISPTYLLREGRVNLAGYAHERKPGQLSVSKQPVKLAGYAHERKSGQLSVSKQPLNLAGYAYERKPGQLSVSKQPLSLAGYAHDRKLGQLSVSKQPLNMVQNGRTPVVSDAAVGYEEPIQQSAIGLAIKKAEDEALANS